MRARAPANRFRVRPRPAPITRTEIVSGAAETIIYQLDQAGKGNANCKAARKDRSTQSLARLCALAESKTHPAHKDYTPYFSSTARQALLSLSRFASRQERSAQLSDPGLIELQ